ncbi:hypothetical protein [Butyrivibrio sp. AC2005]|uniref:hypothetical protein n=1 Tax=Butyrivibrio sp. AC2005 TaxID=1280672 RepID=UPI000412AF33|nr:hypothetical protein [Butyrivibrio sp. AC2005]
MKRFLCLIKSLVMLTFMSISVCAESTEEEAITKQINTFMRAVKAYKPAKIDSCGI